MTDTALATTLRPEAMLAASVDHFTALVKLKSAIMKKGIDYGPIPGCGGKDSLFKPGAEKTLRNFMVHTSPGDTTIEDLSAGGEIRYRITIGGRTPDGVVRGFGIGECSTAEDKYAWRKAVSQAEHDDTTDDRRRVKHYANYTAQQVRANPADHANTVLKIAKKRAMVDLALTSCAASQFFTQDIEDLPPELRGEVIDVPLATEPAPAPEPGADRPPEGWPVNKRVHWYMQRLGLSPEAVTAAAEMARAPGNSDNWSEADGQAIIQLLHSPPPADPAPPPAADPAPATEPAKARTRRTRCGVCSEMCAPGLVVQGECPDCRAKRLAPDGATPLPTGKACRTCLKHTPTELLKSGLCPMCQTPAGAPGKRDVVCQRCKAGAFWPTQMTFVGEHGLVCGECVVILGLAGKEPTRFACIAGCGLTVEVEGGKCSPCALKAAQGKAPATPPARPAGPDGPKTAPHEMALEAIRRGIAEERFTQAEALEAMKADEECRLDYRKWTEEIGRRAVALLDGLDCRPVTRP